MTATTTSAALEPSATVKQAGAAVLLGFMGFIFFSIAIASWALERVDLPASALADAERLQAFVPFAVISAVAHLAVAVMAVSLNAAVRRVATAVSATTAGLFGVGAIAVAAGWNVFQRSAGGPSYGFEGATILAAAATVYAGAAALIARSRPS